ncbi:hypothetical protein QAD02_014824 [Eretmocerus hayati]|uniref:Uncharacterized protein n=1 Tax=Eretmocerus hayati TaxID=131215 RepID=A0ACC2P6J4_9HYME|nr:hypothetical protein QAD02_014824 [Eretmocerus hayati]
MLLVMFVWIQKLLHLVIDALREIEENEGPSNSSILDSNSNGAESNSFHRTEVQMPPIVKHSSSNNASTPDPVSDDICQPSLETLPPASSECVSDNFRMQASESYDFGDYVGQTLSAEMKKQLLLNPWSPPPGYIFPYSTHNKRDKIEKRGSCKNVPLKRFVTQPLTNFSKVCGKTGDFICHSESEYHKNALAAAKDFLYSISNPTVNVKNQINTHRIETVLQNRKNLKAVTENVVFLGKQNISFRGHRDYGPIDVNSKTNEGNFRELLKFRIQCGDEVLRNHIEKASSRETLVSGKTQNDLIKCCGDEITSVIISRVRRAKYYSIIFDETTDISLISQLTIILRYIYEGQIYEDFMRFVDLFKELRGSETVSEEQCYLELKVTGLALGSFVVKTLKELGLVLEGCVGITTDGCSVNVSESCGAVVVVKNELKRRNCDVVFSSLFNEICELADKIDVVIRMPRVVANQNHRDNHPAQTPEEYFKRSVYIPLLDNVLEDLNARFAQNTMELYHLFILLPGNSSWNDKEATDASIMILSDKYCDLLNLNVGVMRASLQSELNMWRLKWERIGFDPSRKALEYLRMCDEDIFPIVHALLSIFVTLPLSSASAARSFSSLKRIKTWLRSTMGEERLVGLALLHIHHELELDLDHVMDRYAAMRKRRNDLIL